MTAIERFQDHTLKDRLVALTRDLVIIPSTSSRPDARERCFRLVHNHLDAIEDVQIREYQRRDYPSLVALPAGCTRPAVLLCGHVDVVGLPDDASYKSKLADGRIYGPGAGDMKGQVSILLELFRTFHHRYPGVPLGMAVTTDEEVGGTHGTGYLFGEVGLRCGVAVIPDGGSLEDVTVEEKGILHLRLTVQGHAGHAARPWLVASALETLIESIGRLRRRFDALATDDEEHWYPTCTPTVLTTDNDTVNRIPSRAEALLDIRFPPPHTMLSMMDMVRETLADAVEIELLVGGEPSHLAPDPAYFDIAQAVTGKTIRRGRESGGSDARFICRHGIPVIMARPEVGNLHGEDEWIDIASMVTFYHICERYLEHRLSQGSRPINGESGPRSRRGRRNDRWQGNQQ
jgi:succinyl-diaminopimelate desuccinylase